MTTCDSNKHPVADLNTMKLIHALVGYMTVTALPPFHPFAFAASQLTGIHYDGYVDVDRTSTQNRIRVIDDAEPSWNIFLVLF